MGLKHKYLAFLPVLSCLIAACTLDKDKKVDKDNPRHGTTDSSVMFFKNMRQYYYEKDENRETGIVQYRYKEQPALNSAEPGLAAAIVYNWRSGQAYILVETSVFFEDEAPIVVEWESQTKGENGQFVFERGNSHEHFVFAAELYTALQEGHGLSFLAKGSKYPLFVNKQAREAFRITLSDYYRLVGVFR